MKIFYPTIVLLIFSSILTISCEEDFYTIVKGKVIDSETERPVEGFILDLREMESEIGAWSYTLETSETDSLCEFYHAFEAEDNMIYSIKSVDNIGYSEINSAVVHVNVGETNEYFFEVEPETN